MRYALLASLLLATACTSIKVTTKGLAVIDGGDPEAVLSQVVQATTDAEFTVLNVNADLGMISAQDATNPLLANSKTLSLTIFVRATDRGTKVDVTSTLPGQMLAYGATEKAVQRLFSQLAIYLPEARLHIDGKPFTP